MGKQLTGSEILLESLHREKVEVVFGLPGGAVLPLYDALYSAGIRHLLVRHEQAAAFGADGLYPGSRLDGPGPRVVDRKGCLPGGRHGGYQPALYEKVLSGDVGG